MDLTEAEDTKKRWQEYTEELYKKDLHDPDNHDGVIICLENPMDGGAWWATVHGVAKSRARLSDFTSLSLNTIYSKRY